MVQIEPKTFFVGLKEKARHHRGTVRPVRCPSCGPGRTIGNVVIELEGGRALFVCECTTCWRVWNLTFEEFEEATTRPGPFWDGQPQEPSPT